MTVDLKGRKREVEGSIVWEPLLAGALQLLEGSEVVACSWETSLSYSYSLQL